MTAAPGYRYGMADIPKGRFGRFTRIAGLATQVGAGLAADRVKRVLGMEGTGPEDAARRVLETLGTMKGAALKAGQTLSQFSGHMPAEVRAIVGKLFSQAPKLPYEEVAAVVREELGAAPEDIFASFTREPLAAASLAQVHLATLKSGEQVVVKIQYPGVAAALEADLRNIESLLKTVGMGGALLDGKEYIAELRTEIAGELDYRRELSFLEQFRTFLARWPDVVVPRAYPELCTGRVLVLELLEGPTLNEFTHKIDQVPEDERRRIGDQLLRATWGPWLYHRAIHADTHPGNYVVLADGRLGVLDFGVVKFGAEPFWRASLDAVDALVNGTEVDWLEVLRRAGFSFPSPEEKARKIVGEIMDIARAPVSGPYDFGEDPTLAQMADLKLKYPLDLIRFRAPAESLLVGRGLAGLLSNLKALRMKDDIRPFFQSALREVRGQSPA